jgi:hypothetical protein
LARYATPEDALDEPWLQATNTCQYAGDHALHNLIQLQRFPMSPTAMYSSAVADADSTSMPEDLSGQEAAS